MGLMMFLSVKLTFTKFHHLEKHCFMNSFSFESSLWIKASFLVKVLGDSMMTNRFIEGDFDTYVSRIRKPHVWGGEPELLMLQHVLR